MKVLKFICNVLSTTIIAALLFIAVMMLGPKIFGMSEYVVLSGSMEPTIAVGSIVYDKALDETSLADNDIVTYSVDRDTLVTHRAVSVDLANRQVITKGDANQTEDEVPVSFDRIVGVHVFHMPYIGYISMYVKTGLGIGVVCGIVVLLILLNAIPGLIEDEEKEKKNDLPKESDAV